MLSMLDYGRAIVHFGRVAVGGAYFVKSRKTPLWAYASMRALFVFSNGRFNQVVVWASRPRGKGQNGDLCNGVLGRLDLRSAANLAAEIEEKGFKVFDVKLDPSLCKKLVEFARAAPAFPVPPADGRQSPEVYDPKRPLAPRYDFGEHVLLELPIIQDLVTDESLLAVARAYLRCQPVNDLVAMWWSTPYGAASSEAGQLFHFDADRIRFIKFFFYLTDVGPDNGPHCFVESSHRRKPKALLRDGRFTDEEILREYPEKVANICGDMGTILAVDTSGFHKGVPPRLGERLLLQLEFADSLFGQSYERVPLNAYSKAVAETVARLPRTFERLVST